MKRKLVLSVAFTTAAAMALAGTALAQGGRGMGMRGDRDGHPFFGIAVLCVVAAIAIVGTWLIVRRSPPAVAASAAIAPAPVQRPTANAEAILAERLARSEISADDYRTALAALRESAAGPLSAASSQ
ncbi:MAG: hypothetical protein WCC60_14685 [Ilumatobacteraceae bacterium]